MDRFRKVLWAASVGWTLWGTPATAGDGTGPDGSGSADSTGVVSNSSGTVGYTDASSRFSYSDQSRDSSTHGSYNTDQSDHSAHSASEANSIASGDGPTANRGGVATAVQADHGSATAQDEARIDLDHSRATAGDHSAASHRGNVSYSASDAELSGTVSQLTVYVGGPASAGAATWTAHNSLENSANGAAGITQVVQNLGHAALVQQQVGVNGSVNAGR
jgi:hypothetical protein